MCPQLLFVLSSLTNGFIVPGILVLGIVLLFFILITAYTDTYFARVIPQFIHRQTNQLFRFSLVLAGTK